MLSHRNYISGMYISRQSTDSNMGHLLESEREPLAYRMVIKSFHQLLQGVTKVLTWGT